VADRFLISQFLNAAGEGKYQTMGPLVPENVLGFQKIFFSERKNVII
jgi:hypothetical protein